MKEPPLVIIKNLDAQRNVSFFLRIHGHLPDEVCGTYESVLWVCEYRKDGKPINKKNDYVEKLRKKDAYLEAEKQVIEAQEKGISIRKNKA